MRWSLFWDRLWNFPLSELQGKKKFFYKWLRIFALAGHNFIHDRCNIRASSLTFYSLMSIVPVLALCFAIARGFGLQEHFREEILERFTEYETVLNEIISFANQLLEQTKGGLIAGFGLALLFWSAIQLIRSMEDVMNSIWDVKKMRSWRRIMSEYFSLVLIAPLFFILSNSTAVFAVHYLEGVIRHLFGEQGISPLLLFFIHLLPYGLFWLFFTFLYYFLPNTRVQSSSAYTGGIVAGTLYLLVQWVYLYFQIGVSRYGAVYGSFAALPLFLIWLQVSWYIFLFGAEISHAHQTHDQHEFANIAEKAAPCLRKVVSLWIMQMAVRKFQEEHLPITAEFIVQKGKIPAALAFPMIRDLVEVGLLIEVKEESYLPGRPASEIKILDVLQALETKGITKLPFLTAKEVQKFEQSLQKFATYIDQSGENRLLIEL